MSGMINAGENGKCSRDPWKLLRWRALFIVAKLFILDVFRGSSDAFHHHNQQEYKKSKKVPYSVRNRNCFSIHSHTCNQLLRQSSHQPQSLVNLVNF